MNARERAIFKIYKESIQLFHDHGFEGTSVRMISEKANTSASMINHYFGSKEQLGSDVFILIGSYAYSSVLKYLSLEEKPVLYDLTLNRISFLYIFNNGYKDFYLDAMKLDFPFRFKDLRTTKLIESLSKKYAFEFTSDDALLYCHYLPFIIEKTLVLKKEEGEFSTYEYDQIPNIISEMSVGHFISDKEVKRYEEEADYICKQILPSLSPDIPDEYIERYMKNKKENKEFYYE